MADKHLSFLMEAFLCGLGFQEPKFHDRKDMFSVREAFKKDGIVFLNNCDEAILVDVGKRLGKIVKPRNEAINGTGVSNIRCAPGLEGKGYSSEELFFHTDRSGWEHPPQVLITTLKVKSLSGGESLLADGWKVVEYIKSQEPDLYRLITNPKYSSFRADSGQFVPTPLFDEKNNILRMRFDDGVQFSASLIGRLPTLREIIYKHAFAVNLQPSQSYIVDNHRFFHGRTSFEGERELLRVLAYPHMAESVKAILFDIDGTLCRSEALSIDAFYRCLTDLAGKPITHENTKVNLHGQTDVSLLHDILRYHDFSEAETAETIQKFFKVHPGYLEESHKRGFESVPCTGAHDMLAWLKSKQSSSPNVSIGLLTGNSKPNALFKLRAAGIDTGLFDLDISSFGDSHPDRVSLVRSSLKSLETKYGLSVNPQNVALIGDTPLDVECAKLGGCKIVAVATGHYSMGQLQALEPDLLCEKLEDATGWIENALAN